MKKKLIKILESIAGLADPKPKADLDEKYRKAIASTNLARTNAGAREMTASHAEAFIADMKARDRYGEKPLGFPRDWSFRPGDTVEVNAELADKWIEVGLCVPVTVKDKSERD